MNDQARDPQIPSPSGRSELLVTMLAIAMVGEMGRVTEASTEIVMADRDRWMQMGIRAVKLKAEAEAIHTAAEERELTDDERATAQRLNEEAGSLYEECDTNTAIGRLGVNGDNLLYGGPGCAKAFATLAHTLAHLAHRPGGVTFAGYHWCTRGHMAVPMGRFETCDKELERAS